MNIDEITDAFERPSLYHVLVEVAWSKVKKVESVPLTSLNAIHNMLNFVLLTSTQRGNF